MRSFLLCMPVVDYLNLKLSYNLIVIYGDELMEI